MRRQLSKANSAAPAARPATVAMPRQGESLEEWRQTQQMLKARYGIQVRHPAFPTLTFLAVVLLVVSWFAQNLWLAFIAGILAVSLSLWNKRAAEANRSAETSPDTLKAAE